MKYRTIKVTPEIAKVFLEKNTNNRGVAIKRVHAYADDMRNGKWFLNGEPIIFSNNGQLRDGQHRLLAVIESGCEVEMTAVYEVDDDITLFDRGRGRSASDALVISGVESTAFSCSIATLYWAVQGIDRRTAGETKMRTFHEEHAESIEFVSEICKGRVKGGINVRSSFFGTAVLLAYENGISQEKLREFADIVREGFQTDKSQSSAVVIRNDIMRGLCSKNTTKEKIKYIAMVQNAISDFDKGIERKRTYKSATELIYNPSKD